MTVQNESDDAQLINEIATRMARKVTRRRKDILEPNFDVGEFVRVPIKDALGNSCNIGILIIKSDNPLPGNPIVLFAPGDNENIDGYKGEYYAFTKHGVNFCAMDYRGNGYSEGEYITYGDNEIDDVFAVIRYLYQSGYQKVSYFGRSRGATCGLYAAYEFPNLTSVALDSPRIHSGRDDEYISEKFNVPIEKVREILPLIYKKIIELIGIDFSRDSQPCEFAGQIRQPIYVIHGETDICIPISESRELMTLLGSEEKRFDSFNSHHNDFFKRYPFWMKQFYFIVKHSGSDVSEEEFNQTYDI